MLSQADADTLLGMEKLLDDLSPLDVAPGVEYARELRSVDESETFKLDIRASGFRLTKYRYQNRSRKIHILARLDIDGTPHRNPDGEKIVGSHIHYYREGFEDKWAQPIDPSVFSDTSNRELTLREFLNICHVLDNPAIVQIAQLLP